MTRAQILARSWQYDEKKDKWTGFDGEESWCIERDIGTGKWFAARAGKSLVFEVSRRRGSPKRITRFWVSAAQAMTACEAECYAVHMQQIAERIAKGRQ
jgi:hypothetical protein